MGCVFACPVEHFDRPFCRCGFCDVEELSHKKKSPIGISCVTIVSKRAEVRYLVSKRGQPVAKKSTKLPGLKITDVGETELNLN